jgi:hydrogenase expression/formation protein HypE
MHRVAGKAKVQVVTGDTKVVGKGGADRIFINTAGIGEVHEGVRLGREMVRAGDVVILSGTIGDHAASVLSSRAGLEFDTGIRSDCAPLYGLVRPILRLGRTVRFMRDPTRGGVAATLNELVGGSRLGVLLDEGRLPVREEVQGFCELLGYDPLYLANEGKVIIVASAKSAERVIKLLRKHPLGRRATAIGEVTDEFRGIVGLRTPYGGTRIVDMPVGEQFPRIC